MAEHRTDKKDGWQRYDWALIECVYVTSIPGIGLRQIAKKYGCNIKTVERHSRKDNWFQKRKEFIYAVRREVIIKNQLRIMESSVLEIINEDRSAAGLEPMKEIRPELRSILREEIEQSL